jgi:hypothetical protein
MAAATVHSEPQQSQNRNILTGMLGTLNQKKPKLKKTEHHSRPKMLEDTPREVVDPMGYRF